MGAQHHAHLLQHVAVVVDAGLVEPDRDVDPLRLEAVERRDAAAQAKVRAAIVADIGSGLGELVEVASRRARRHVRASSSVRAGRSGSI